MRRWHANGQRSAMPRRSPSGGAGVPSLLQGGSHLPSDQQQKGTQSVISGVLLWGLSRLSAVLAKLRAIAGELLHTAFSIKHHHHISRMLLCCKHRCATELHGSVHCSQLPRPLLSCSADAEAMLCPHMLPHNESHPEMLQAQPGMRTKACRRITLLSPEPHLSPLQESCANRTPLLS